MPSVEIIEAILSVLWFILVVILIGIFYRPIRHELLPKLTKVSAMGVELSFVRKSMDDAIQLAEKSPQWKVEIPEAAKDQAVNRAKEHLDILQGTQILWVDDHPENNVNERRMFRQLRVDIDTARETSEALTMVQNAGYDLVISDMARGNEPAAGLTFLEHLRQAEHTVPAIFYIGITDPSKGVPASAFGLTNRPDELLHLILDVLERRYH